MKRLSTLLVALVGLMLSTAPKAAALTFPLPADGDRSRYGYEFTLLQAALNASQPHDAKPDPLQWSAQPMNLNRARIEVASGHLSVVYGYSDPEIEQQLTPIPFSIDKGLNSYRILLTRRSLLPQLAAARKADDLRDLRFGVLASWSDRRILQEQGFKVEATTSFSGLFKMLSLGRSDVIMSGLLHVTQITPLLAAHSELQWEPALLIMMPTQQRFYTARTPAGEALSKRVLRGLQAMQASGEFDRLHALHFGTQGSASKGRRVIHLLNAKAAKLSPARQ